mgnify:CR=1 FL=1
MLTYYLQLALDTKRRKGLVPAILLLYICYNRRKYSYINALLIYLLIYNLNLSYPALKVGQVRKYKQKKGQAYACPISKCCYHYIHLSYLSFLKICSSAVSISFALLYESSKLIRGSSPFSMHLPNCSISSI